MSRRTARAVWIAAIGLALLPDVLLGSRQAAAGSTEGPRHAIAMHGDPTLPAGFSHFRYVDPSAPKGGRMVQGLLGTFDSLNPLIVKGLPLGQIRPYVVESLMARGYDEPFTLYGLVAQAVETDAARSFVSFTLDARARFSDGTPITPQDVIFSWRLLRDKGRPNYRAYYTKVAKAAVTGPRTVRFDFADASDRELPLILGLMPILAEHATSYDGFEETSFIAPLGSGPYRVAEVRPGERVTLARDPDYWGRDLPVNAGLWNFDEIRFDFYRDANGQFEAFRKGLFDIRPENDPARWETAYDFPAAREGRVVKDAFANGLPKRLSAFVFNTRRLVFADIRVREALGLLFDAGWINQNFFFGGFRRTASYFADSQLSAHRRPADATERKLLGGFPGTVRPDIMDGTWSAPAGDGSGRDRAALKRAIAMLASAGWRLEGAEMRNRVTGEPFAFEILVTNRDQERLALAYARDLKRAGIAVSVRVVDAVQYDQRRQTFDFDMIENNWDQSLSPGNEQSFYWGSQAADQPGSRNYMGAKNPAVDAAIGAMLAAAERPQFVSAVRALDRALLSGFYVVPLFHAPEQWVARWAHIGRPAVTSVSGYLPETWWRREEAQSSRSVVPTKAGAQ